MLISQQYKQHSAPEHELEDLKKELAQKTELANKHAAQLKKWEESLKGLLEKQKESLDSL